MGAQVEERPDGLVIKRSRMRGTEQESHADHRMVMALAVAGLAAEGKTTISDIDCVKKTFPSFVQQMQGLGCEMATD
jgi:3-phosphoshikimate 1-carboxyvinyltransferase